MKPVRAITPFLLVCLLALILYFISFRGIEHLRTRHGPWHISFTNQSDTPTLVIDETNLNLTAVKITFPGRPPFATNTVITFDPPQPVPFDVPGGQCIFLDTTFQPGTVVLHLFDHEIQLLPRILTIDQSEHPWQSATTITLTNTPAIPH